MSFSFTAQGSPKEVIAAVGQHAAAHDHMPNSFSDAINTELAVLPDDATVELSTHGHVGWSKDQTDGGINLHCTIRVSVPPIDPPRPAPPVELEAEPAEIAASDVGTVGSVISP